MGIANCGFYHTFRVSPTFCHYLERINHRGHNRKDGAFEIEQPEVGPEGEPSGSERVKEHGETLKGSWSRVAGCLWLVKNVTYHEIIIFRYYNHIFAIRNLPNFFV